MAAYPDLRRSVRARPAGMASVRPWWAAWLEMVWAANGDGYRLREVAAVARRYHLRSFRSRRDGDLNSSSRGVLSASWMVAGLDVAAMTTTGMLPSFDTMFGRATGAAIRRYPKRASPPMKMSRSLRPLVSEGIRLMVRHPYDGPQGTRPRHEVITAQAGGARSAIAAQAITRSWAPDV